MSIATRVLAVPAAASEAVAPSARSTHQRGGQAEGGDTAAKQPTLTISMAEKMVAFMKKHLARDSKTSEDSIDFCFLRQAEPVGTAVRYVLRDVAPSLFVYFGKLTSARV